MKFLLVLVIVAVALGLRVVLSRRRRKRRATRYTDAATVTVTPAAPRRASPSFGRRFGPVGLVALREIRERVRGRIFRIGTIVILLAVGAAIIIPATHGKSTTQAQKVGRGDDDRGAIFSRTPHQ